MTKLTITRDEWLAKAQELFGKSTRDWRFVCPVCKTEQSIQDFLDYTDLDKPMISSVAGFSCIGRWAKGGCEHRGLGPKSVTDDGDKKEKSIGCDYAGGGLFKLNPVLVTHEDKEHAYFDFAETST